MQQVSIYKTMTRRIFLVWVPPLHHDRNSTIPEVEKLKEIFAKRQQSVALADVHIVGSGSVSESPLYDAAMEMIEFLKYYDTLYIYGSRATECAREIVREASYKKLRIYNQATEGSELYRYVRWFTR